MIVTIVSAVFEDADDEEDGIFGVANGKYDPYIRFIFNKKVKRTDSTREPDTEFQRENFFTFNQEFELPGVKFELQNNNTICIESHDQDEHATELQGKTRAFSFWHFCDEDNMKDEKEWEESMTMNKMLVGILKFKTRFEGTI